MRVKVIYRAVLIAVLNVVFPLLAGLVALAPAVIPILGEQWREAVPLIQILAMAALAQAIISPVGQIMKGLGRPGWLVTWSVGFTLVTGVALWIGAAGGLRGARVEGRHCPAPQNADLTPDRVAPHRRRARPR